MENPSAYPRGFNFALDFEHSGDTIIWDNEKRCWYRFTSPHAKTCWKFRVIGDNKGNVEVKKLQLVDETNEYLILLVTNYSRGASETARDAKLLTNSSPGALSDITITRQDDVSYGLDGNPIAKTAVPIKDFEVTFKVSHGGLDG